MATAVLRSQDCLQQRFHLDAFRCSSAATTPSTMKSGRRKASRSPSPPSPNTSSSKSKPRSGGRCVKFAGVKDDRVNPMVVKSGSKNLVMEKVTILKRGEELTVDRRSNGCDSPDPVFSGRIGPASPKILPKQISLVESKTSEVIYAGPGFVASPAPSSLPFPASLVIKKGANEATKGLLSLLRLDILP